MLVIREQYDLIKNIEKYVIKILGDWDPCDFEDANEYDIEAKEIIKLLADTNNVPELAENIEDVFVQFFGERPGRERDLYVKIAQDIWDYINSVKQSIKSYSRYTMSD